MTGGATSVASLFSSSLQAHVHRVLNTQHSDDSTCDAVICTCDWWPWPRQQIQRVL